MRDGNGNKVLVRSRDGRMLAGVCAGIASYFGFDVTLVRVIWAVVSVLTGGAGVLAYLAAWAIIPDEGQKSPIDENIVSTKQGAWQADGPMTGLRPFFNPAAGQRIQGTAVAEDTRPAISAASISQRQPVLPAKCDGCAAIAVRSISLRQGNRRVHRRAAIRLGRPPLRVPGSSGPYLCLPGCRVPSGGRRRFARPGRNRHHAVGTEVLAGIQRVFRPTGRPDACGAVLAPAAWRGMAAGWAAGVTAVSPRGAARRYGRCARRRSGRPR
jgi:phage shock protein PspC (stress-responsive transcriptional regulator)